MKAYKTAPKSLQARGAESILGSKDKRSKLIW